MFLVKCDPLFAAPRNYFVTLGDLQHAVTRLFVRHLLGEVRASSPRSCQCCGFSAPAIGVATLITRHGGNIASWDWVGLSSGDKPTAHAR